MLFSADGFYHATHNGRGMSRNEVDQRLRLNLLPFVPELVANATKYEKETTRAQSINGKTKVVYYYRLCSEIRVNGTRYEIAVILRRIGNGGKLRYYSVFCVSKKAE